MGGAGRVRRKELRSRNGVENRCPWEDSNPVLERCWRNTVLRPEEREPGWDPMDLDESEGEGEGEEEYGGEPMDLD